MRPKSAPNSPKFRFNICLLNMKSNEEETNRHGNDKGQIIISNIQENNNNAGSIAGNNNNKSHVDVRTTNYSQFPNSQQHSGKKSVNPLQRRSILTSVRKKLSYNKQLLLNKDMYAQHNYNSISYQDVGDNNQDGVQGRQLKTPQHQQVFQFSVYSSKIDVQNIISRLRIGMDLTHD